jgi:hypothetical protein
MTTRSKDAIRLTHEHLGIRQMLEHFGGENYIEGRGSKGQPQGVTEGLDRRPPLRCSWAIHAYVV